MSSENGSFRGSLGFMKWTPAQQAIWSERFAEALRECGILWLVFSLLDRVVAGHLTVPWTCWNLTGSIAVWVFGMYIEARKR